MFKNMKLKRKLVIYFFAVGIIPLILIATISTFQARNALEANAFNQLEAVQMIKKSQIEGFFNERMSDAKIFADMPFIENAIKELDIYSKEAVSQGYTGKQLLDYPNYKKAFDKYYPFVKKYMETYGYYDVFLFSPNSGRVLLSVALEADFGTELSSESHSLAKSWQKMKESKKTEFVDMAPYAPSNDAPAMFIVQPAYSNGNYIGSIGLQVSDASINAIMQERSGMGETGETYLVGSDFKMRSDSYLDPDNHSIKASIAGTVQKNGVDTKATRDAVAGKDGKEIIIDYNGNPVLSVFEAIELPSGVKWIVIAEIDKAEAFAASNSMTNMAIILSIIIGVLIIFFGVTIAKSISKPIIKTNEMIKKMSVGNLRMRLENDSKDEIGEMSQAMNTLAGNLTGFVGMMNEVAAGNLDIDWEIKDPEDQIAPGLYNILASLRALISETKMLIDAAVEGNLSVRGDESKFKGGYLDIVHGVNNTLDAVILPVKEGSDVLEVMSTGDLTVRVTGDYKGDHQIIKNSINSLGDSVGGLIMQLSEAVEATASASTQISSSAEEMAAGAQEQSSQTAEVSAAMEEMSRTIVETANNATNSAEVSQAATKKANIGTEKLNASKKGMEEIVEATETVGSSISSLANKTDQIGEIAQVIDDIADQTNLLALNAAIEAARAGEQGRGFAVVADEVRKLAERTTKATKEIAETIKEIQTEAKEANSSMEMAGVAVNKGLELNGDVANVLSGIIESVEDAAQQITQVAAASEEQSATAEQVSTNIEAINNVANESAQGVQQIASASEDLNRLTENLSELVAQFRLSNEDGGNGYNHTNSLANHTAELIEQ